MAPKKSGGRLDRLGVMLSGLCLMHCVVGLLLVAGLGLGGSLFLDPIVHQVGLGLAVIVAAGAIFLGGVRHRRKGPLITAGIGIAAMASALFVGHGVEEAVLTIIGVALVAVGHWMNMRLGCPTCVH